MEEEIDTNSKKSKTDGPFVSLHNRIGESFLKFTDPFPNCNVKLFEISPELADLIENGEESLKIVGSQTDAEAVFCTTSKTYSIKKVETSNSVFLIGPSDSNSFDIISKSNHYFELSKITGKIDKIEALLKPTQIDENERIEITASPHENNTSFLSRKDLNELIQASDEEIGEELLKLNAIEVDSYDGSQKVLRMINQRTIYKVARNLFDNIIENSWDLNNIDEQQCIACMRQLFEPVVVSHVISLLGKRANDESNHYIWNLNQLTVAQYSAHALFTLQLPQAYKNGWPIRDFELKWEECTPGRLDYSQTSSEDILKSIANIIEIGEKKYFIYLPHHQR